MSAKVEHNTAQHRFVLVIDGKECSLDYDVVPGTPVVLVIYRTFVHSDLRGRKIAEQLCAAITEHAAKNHFAIRPDCSYAVLYFKKHPDAAPLLAQGVDLENGGSCRIG